MTKRMAFMLAILVVAAGTMWGKKKDVKRPDSEYYTQAVEAYDNDDFETAIAYLVKELAQHPNNGYAWGYYALAKGNSDEIGVALNAAEKSVDKIPKNDPEYKSWAHNIRGQIYKAIGDTVKAIADFSEAIKWDPTNDANYLSRSELYAQTGQYDLAHSDMDVLIDKSPGTYEYPYQKAGLYYNQKDYDKSLNWINRAIRLDGTRPLGYTMRGQIYFGQKKYREAIDDCIKSLSLDGTDNSFLIGALTDSASIAFIAKLKAQAVKEPNNDSWPYYIGVVYETGKQYRKANEYYIASHKKEPAPTSAFRIAKCFQEVGDYDNAILYIDGAIELAGDYEELADEYTYFKAEYENESGRFEDAVKDYTTVIEKNPDLEFYRYSRAISYRHLKQYDKALEDINTAIAIDPETPYYYDVQGRVYQLMGNHAKARESFQKVIDTDTTDLKTHALYAYAFLGVKEKAVEYIDKLLKDDCDKNNLYNAACVYAIMNDADKAMAYLGQAMQAGWRDFSHMDYDEDMDNLRNLTAYKNLVAEYKAILAKEIEADDDARFETVTTEVPFTKENGVTKVKCTINGLPLHFVFDTGASTVTISSVEATFMVKNDYLTTKDISGKNYYSDALGEIKEGTTLNLREVEFGGIVLNDVKASVIHSQSAPMLLGQSVFQKLGSIEIDNEKSVLRITYRKRVSK